VISFLTGRQEFVYELYICASLHNFNDNGRVRM
jgi:hypothetical protein